jgi:hypothetical protein
VLPGVLLLPQLIKVASMNADNAHLSKRDGTRALVFKKNVAFNLSMV